MIEVDGSIGEGGGQILRTACALSIITGKSCRIFNIRSGRKNPGLQTQHLLGLRALEELSSGNLEGDFLSSKEIKFCPGEIKSNHLHINIKTAGSITLLLQTLIPPALLSEEGLNIDIEGGGTDTFFSPTMDYFKHCFLKILEKIGIHIEVNIIRRGYYPEGGGRVKVKIFPIKTKKLGALNLIERGEFKSILITSGASDTLREKKVAERQIMGAKEILGKLGLPIEEKVDYSQTLSPGSYICLAAKFENTIIGTDNLGKLGKRAEDVGRETALELLEEQKSGACLDKHLADQILLYMALSKEKSRISTSRITKHCQTNMKIIEKFIEGKFTIKGNIISWEPGLE